MLVYENKIPEITLIKLNDHKHQMYPTHKQYSKQQLSIRQQISSKQHIYKTTKYVSNFPTNTL